MKKGWPTKPLGEVCEVFADGDWVESKDQSSEGVRLIQTGNVGEGMFKDRAEKARYISEATFKRLRCTEIFAGDCLVSRLPDPVGRSCILPDTGERMITAVDCTILRFNPKQLLSTFFNHYSQSDDYLTTVAKECTGTTRNRISRSNLGLTSIPVPPFAEQQRIVGLLDEAFESIATAKANAEKNLQNARALFESHLQSVFTQRGKGWVETTLEKVLSVQPQNGWSPPAANHSASGMPVLTLSSVTGFKFRPDKVKYTSAATDPKKKYWVKDGDFLITRSNTPELVGHVAIASGIEKPTIYPDLIMRMNPVPDRAMKEFLYYHLRTPALRKEIMGRAQGANPTMKKISNGAVKTLPIAVPPIATQRAIVETMNALSEETQRLARLYERKLAALEALKKSLLHRAFTGTL
jgi:type I restriction enzyme S subunit